MGSFARIFCLALSACMLSPIAFAENNEVPLANHSPTLASPADAGPASTTNGFGASDTSCPTSSNQSPAQALHDSEDWVLRWHDEFDTPGLPDPARWNYESGRVRNGEAQYYTSGRQENARVEDGHLIITARKESWEGAEYTSASLTTLDRLALTYGKIEICAKVPAGRGTWPALWTLANYDPHAPGGYDGNGGRSRWPLGGEIDIMEYVGMNPDQLFFTVHTQAYNHTKGTQRGHNIVHSHPWEEFHRYGIVWTPERIDWFFDGRLVFSFANDGKGPETWPFDSPQYLIMNLAIGGGWGGQKGIDDTIFPAELIIDYVRVWQRPGLQ